MHLQRLLIIVISIFGIIGSIMPWVSVKTQGTFYGTDGDGWISLFLYALCILFAILAGSRKRSLRAGWLIGVSIPALLASLLGVWKILDFIAIKKQPALGVDISSFYIMHPGIYIVAAAGFVTIVAALFFKASKKEIVQ